MGKWARSIAVTLTLFSTSLGQWRLMAEDSTPPSVRTTVGIEHLLAYGYLSGSRPGDQMIDPSSGRIISAFSPDHSRFAVVVRRGDLRLGENTSEIIVFEGPLFRVGRSVFQARSSRGDEPISHLAFLSDQKLAWLSQQDEAPHGVKILDLRGNRITDIRSGQGEIEDFFTAPGGQFVVTYSDKRMQAPNERPECLSNGCRVDVDSLGLFARGRTKIASNIEVHDLRSSTSKYIPSIEGSHADVAACAPSSTKLTSPDAKFAIVRCWLKSASLPETWLEFARCRNLTTTEASTSLQALYILDFQTGRSRRLTNSPFAFTEGDIIWRSPSTVQIFAPTSRNLQNCAKGYDLTNIDLNGVTRSQALNIPISSAPLLLSDGDRSTRLVANDNAGSPKVWYIQFSNGQWRLKAATKTFYSDQIDVTRHLEVSQSLNDWPTLVMRGLRGDTIARLLDPNPELRGLRLGRVEASQISVSESERWRINTYYPPGFDKTHRYPLFIQTHSCSCTMDSFSLEGGSRNYVAQALAARGIIVVQTAEPMHQGTPAELEQAQSGYEAIVEEYERRNIIRRDRVGISGWSRSGPWAAYTITHSKIPFAVAVFVSTGAMGQTFYYSQGASYQTFMEDLYGGRPVAGETNDWIRNLPSFNAKHASAAVLIEEDAQLPSDLAPNWDWAGALRREGLPVEHWMFPDGQHDMLDASSRAAANSLMLDWIDFWLNDRATPGNIERQRFDRWAALREARRN